MSRGAFAGSWAPLLGTNVRQERRTSNQMYHTVCVGGGGATLDGKLHAGEAGPSDSPLHPQPLKHGAKV